MCANIIHSSIYVGWILRQCRIDLLRNKTIPHTWRNCSLFLMDSHIIWFIYLRSSYTKKKKSTLNLSGDQKFPRRNKMDNLCFDQLNPTTYLSKAKPSFSTHITCVSECVWEKAMKPKGSYYVTDEKLQSVTHMCIAVYSICLFSLNCIKCFSL